MEDPLIHPPYGNMKKKTKVQIGWRFWFFLLQDGLIFISLLVDANVSYKLATILRIWLCSVMLLYPMACLKVPMLRLGLIASNLAILLSNIALFSDFAMMKTLVLLLVIDGLEGLGWSCCYGWMKYVEKKQVLDPEPDNEYFGL